MAPTTVELGWHQRWILNHAFKLCPCGLCHARGLSPQALLGLKILHQTPMQRGMNSQATKMVEMYMKPSLYLILNSQLSDGLTTEGSINEHLPSMNDVFPHWLSPTSNLL